MDIVKYFLQKKSVRLADIATIEESYQTPPGNIMRIDGSPAVGIAISTVPTGNVVDMAEAVKTMLDKFRFTMPEGFSLTAIYDQGHESAVANQGFITNLIISVLTVVAILLFFIGFKNGILIGSGLVFSIFATLIVMMAQGIALQRMSLAAIIIAMGMLVDNAIVVSDSALVNMERGMRKRVAIMRACSSTALPLLAATVIAILTFLPIYYSPHITGELLSSLVIVIGVSLMFSWVFALTQTPFFIQEFVRRPRPDELKAALFDGKYYNMFRRALRGVLRHRVIAVVSLVVMLVLSAWSFKFIPKVLAMHELLQDPIHILFPEPLIKVNKFELSPLTEAMIEARFLGPDAAVLDSLVGVATNIMRRNPKAADVRNEWGNMTQVMCPVYDPVKAGALGITKAQMMQSVKSISDGLPVGIYRDNERKVPVLLKSEGADVTDARSLENFSVWNGERSAPLSQVTDGVETAWEWPQVRTYNRQLSMAAMCGVRPGCTMAEVHGEIRREVEAMELPEGYTFFWDSQFNPNRSLGFLTALLH